MTWPWIQSSVTGVGMWLHACSWHPCQAKQGGKQRDTAVVHVARRTAMVQPASSCSFTWNFFQKKRSNSMISVLPHQLYLLCILTVVWKVLSLWHESQAINCMCYSIYFLLLRKILGFFSPWLLGLCCSLLVMLFQEGLFLAVKLLLSVIFCSVPEASSQFLEKAFSSLYCDDNCTAPMTTYAAK